MADFNDLLSDLSDPSASDIDGDLFHVLDAPAQTGLDRDHLDHPGGVSPAFDGMEDLFSDMKIASLSSRVVPQQTSATPETTVAATALEEQRTNDRLEKIRQQALREVDDDLEKRSRQQHANQRKATAEVSPIVGKDEAKPRTLDVDSLFTEGGSAESQQESFASQQQEQEDKSEKKAAASAPVKSRAPSWMIRSNTGSSSVQSFLHGLGLEGFTQRFVDFGLESMDDLLMDLITKEELEQDIGLSSDQSAEYLQAVERQKRERSQAERRQREALLLPEIRLVSPPSNSMFETTNIHLSNGASLTVAQGAEATRAKPLSVEVTINALARDDVFNIHVKRIGDAHQYLLARYAWTSSGLAADDGDDVVCGSGDGAQQTVRSGLAVPLEKEVKFRVVYARPQVHVRLAVTGSSQSFEHTFEPPIKNDEDIPVDLVPFIGSKPSKDDKFRFILSNGAPRNTEEPTCTVLSRVQVMQKNKEIFDAHSTFNPCAVKEFFVPSTKVTVPS